MTTWAAEELLQILVFEGEDGLSQPRLADDAVRSFKIQGLGCEKHPVDFVQILAQRRDVDAHRLPCGCNVRGEQDRHDAGHKVVVEILGVQVPLVESDGRDVVPEKSNV